MDIDIPVASYDMGELIKGKIRVEFTRTLIRRPDNIYNLYLIREFG